MRKNYSSNFKAKVVLDAIREDKTMSELSSHYGIHRAVIQRWKNIVLEYLPELFSKKKKKADKGKKELIDELYRQIGELRVENEWLKKSLHFIGK